MANIMKMLGLKNKPTRDGYDLQKTLAFTAKPGELLPIYNRVLMPGDKLNIDATWRTRTAPLNRAAFTNFKEYYDWFFVPYSVLWRNYNEWSVGLKDQLTSAASLEITPPLTDDHPYFDSIDIHRVLEHLRDETTENRLNEFGFERSKLMEKLLHYLGYGDWSLNNEWTANIESLSFGRLSPWPLLAYQKIYYDHYRFSQWEQSRPGAFNVDYLDGINTLGLRVPINNVVIRSSERVVYQPNSMIELRYANWNKDMFMGLLPNAQYGDAASVDLSSILSPAKATPGFSIRSENQSSNPVMTNSEGLLFNDTNSQWTLSAAAVSYLRSSLGITSSNLQSAFTILALRQAEALQKYKEIKQSQDLDFPSQTEAHFGVRPNSAYSRKSVRIASFDGVIGISDVDNTNITENSDGSVNEATVAGKGYARGNGKGFTFSTDVPGIIMCIYHVKPILEYALPRISPDILKTRYTDYAIPEFDRTGMQQVPLIYLMNRIPLNINGKMTGVADDALLGYAPIYLDYKTDIDEVKGGFYNGGLESWVAPLTADYVKNWFVYDETLDEYVFRGLNATFFKVNPSVLNPIFANDMDSDVSSDKFWTQVHFNINAVRPLDRNGLPY